MKKQFLILGLSLLLAAGCNSQKQINQVQNRESNQSQNTQITNESTLNTYQNKLGFILNYPTDSTLDDGKSNYPNNGWYGSILISWPRSNSQSGISIDIIPRQFALDQDQKIQDCVKAGNFDTPGGCGTANYVQEWDATKSFVDTAKIGDGCANLNKDILASRYDPINVHKCDIQQFNEKSIVAYVDTSSNGPGTYFEKRITYFNSTTEFVFHIDSADTLNGVYQLEQGNNNFAIAEKIAESFKFIK